ncbi:MAG: hypothetical protein ACOH5I_14195 [Oligoflexus sp.]
MKSNFLILLFFLFPGPLVLAAQLQVLQGSNSSELDVFDLVKAISPDGQKIVGSITSADGLPKPMEWTFDGERYLARDLDLVGDKGAGLAVIGDRYLLANLATADGKPQMIYLARENRRQVKRLIGAPGQAAVTAMTSGNDNVYVVGSVNRQAFIWKESSGEQSLLPTGKQADKSEALTISEDGQWVAGGISGPGFYQAVVWQRLDDGFKMKELPQFDPKLPFAKVSGLSTDGQIIAGAVMTNRGLRAAVWIDDAQPIILPAPQNTLAAFATGMSTDGKRIVGQIKFQNSDGSLRESSFLWEEATGTRLIEDLLSAKDREQVTAWKQFQAELIAADGKTVAGLAMNDSQKKLVWSLRL